MACFIVTTVEAAVVTAAVKREEKCGTKEREEGKRIPLRKVKWLSNLLWGGSAILAFEHLWHAELVPYFPFLTAMYNAQDTAAMLREMMTTGTAMAACITIVWAAMVKVSAVLEKRSAVACQENRIGE